MGTVMSTVGVGDGGAGGSGGRSTRAASVADRSLAVRLAFPGGATGWFESTFTRDGEFRADLHVICRDGLVRLDNFIFPRAGPAGRDSRSRGGAVVAEEPGDGESTYVYQLRAFAAAISSGDPVPTSAEHAAVTMRLIDDAYRAAGLAPRPAAGVASRPATGGTADGRTGMTQAGSTRRGSRPT